MDGGDVLPSEVRALIDRLRIRPWDDPGGLVNMRDAADALLVAYLEVERLREGIVRAMDAKTWEAMYARLESLNG